MITAEDCLELASEKFNCYHIILHGNYYSWYPNDVISKWRKLMGGHVCDLRDHECLPELISTILKMYDGLTKTEAINKIQDLHAKKVVEDALKWHEEEIADVSPANTENTQSDIEVF